VTAQADCVYIVDYMWDGRALSGVFKDGAPRVHKRLPRQDYAQLAGAMLDVYEASLEREYLAACAGTPGRRILE